MYNAKFAVYDVNGDGRKDIIVTGALGLRSLTFSEVYMNAKGRYVTRGLRGTPKYASKYGIYSVEDDYSGAGEERYHTCIAYKISKKGVIKSQYAQTKTTLWYDQTTGKPIECGQVTSNKYINSKNFKKIKKSTYTNAKNLVVVKKLKFHDMTEKNIKKYVK